MRTNRERVAHPINFARIFLGIAALAALLFALTGCTTTTTTAPDGSVTITKAPAPGVLPFAGAALRAYSPRPIIVREEKSGPIDVHAIDTKSVDGHEKPFRERQTIAAEEIANRWKP